MDINCRICFELKEPLVHIFEENLCDLLAKCGGIRVERADSQSKYLCTDCTSELLIAARFREKCERSVESLSEANGTEKSSAFDVFEEWVKEDSEEKAEEDKSMQTQAEYVLQEAECNTIIGTLDDYAEPLNSEEYNTTQTSEESLQVQTKTANVQYTPKSTFECDACGAIFVQAVNLFRHIEKSHKPATIYACNLCDYSFVSLTECERHYSSCYTDNQRTTASALYNGGESSNASNSAKKTKSHVCGYCGKIMPTPFALNTHVRTHTGECPFTCDLCGKTFKTQASLSVHLKRHAGTPDFQCEECGKSFYETSNLKVHMKTHTGEKPHRCKICGQSFARVFLLQIHSRTHTGEKPYKCDKCSRAFAQSADLRYHLKTHTGERHYVCSICQKGFIKRNSLFQHMQRHRNTSSTEAMSLVDDAPELESNESIE